MAASGGHITLFCFLDHFEGGQGRITAEHRILRAPLEFTAKSLPATAGSTFHACAASWARQGAPRGNRANFGQSSVKIRGFALVIWLKNYYVNV